MSRLDTVITEKQLLTRDAKRDIGAELLLSVRQLKAGKGKVVARVEVPIVTLARMKFGLSQAEFSTLPSTLVLSLAVGLEDGRGK